MAILLSFNRAGGTNAVRVDNAIRVSFIVTGTACNLGQASCSCSLGAVIGSIFAQLSDFQLEVIANSEVYPFLITEWLGISRHKGLGETR